MALQRFKVSVDYNSGFPVAFGTNTGFVQAVTLVDSAGASLSGATSNQVQGTAATGAAATGNPVQIAGKDASGNILPPEVTAGSLNGTSIGTAHNSLITNAVLHGYDVPNSQFALLRADAVGLSTVPKPTTSGGLTPFRIVSGTTGFVKASAGQLYTLSLSNTNAAVRYFHLYNKASAPTLSTDTPVYTVPLAASSRIDINFTDIGLAFATGIAWAYTTDNVAIPTTAGTSAEGMFSGAYK